MNRPSEERLLAFLEGRLSDPERMEILDALDADPEQSRRLHAAAAGLEAARAAALETGTPREAARGHTGPAGARRDRPGVPGWWVAAAAAAAVVLTVPTTRLLSGPPAEGPPVAAGIPVQPEPTYLLVLQGRWPDAASIAGSEANQRAEEYWSWTASLAADDVLVAAGDLRWEPGERLGPAGVALAVGPDELQNPRYVVGMIAVRAGSYEQALALARQCPHLRYGGSVSVRRVGAGFVTVPGMGAWSE